MGNNKVKETIKKNITNIFSNKKFGEVFVIENIFEFFDFRYTIENDGIDKNTFIANVSIRNDQQKAFFSSVDHDEDISFVKKDDLTEEKLVEDISNYIFEKYSTFKQHIENVKYDLTDEIERIVNEGLDVEDEWDWIYDDIYETFENSGFDFDVVDESDDEYKRWTWGADEDEIWSKIWKNVFIRMIENNNQSAE